MPEPKELIRITKSRTGGKEPSARTSSLEENGEISIFTVFLEKNGKSPKYQQKQLHGRTLLALILYRKELEQSPRTPHTYIPSNN